MQVPKACKQLSVLVVDTIDTQQSNFTPLYNDKLPLVDKIQTIATELYGTSDVSFDNKALQQLQQWQDSGFGLMGAPKNHTLTVKEVRLSAGAGFIVVICGAIMTMPGLPKKPAANNICLDNNGNIQGLF